MQYKECRSKLTSTSLTLSLSLSIPPSFSLQTPPRPADGTRTGECGGLLELPDNGRCVLDDQFKGHTYVCGLGTVVPLSTFVLVVHFVCHCHGDAVTQHFNKMLDFLFLFAYSRQGLEAQVQESSKDLYWF